MNSSGSFKAENPYKKGPQRTIPKQQERKAALEIFFYSREMDTYKMVHFPSDVKRSDIVGKFPVFIRHTKVVGFTCQDGINFHSGAHSEKR